MPPHTCRILIIDDAPDAALTLAILVRRLGHTVEYVTNPLDAVEVAMRFRPEVVLLDIGMPYINGYHLAPMLREALAPDPVSIIAVTAWGSERDRDLSRAAGFQEHLVKPASHAAIGSVMDRFCAPRP